jgi:DNA polymerase-3 subunit delta'
MSELYPWLVPTYNKISQTFSEGLGHHALLIKVDQGLGVESLFDALTNALCVKRQIMHLVAIAMLAT